VDVFITGITTLSGVKKVLLQVADKGKQPEYLSPLVEGDGQGRVEVVSIDPEKGAAVIKIDGNEKTLSLDKNSPKPAAAGAPAPGAARPVIPNPAGTIPLPGLPGSRPAGLPGQLPGAVSGATPGATGKMGVMMGGGGTGVTPTAGGAAPSLPTGIYNRVPPLPPTVQMPAAPGGATPVHNPLVPQ
jgi:hypothetical protein